MSAIILYVVPENVQEVFLSLTGKRLDLHKRMSRFSDSLLV